MLDREKEPKTKEPSDSARAGFHMISPTAKVVAHFRAYSDIPYAKTIAQEADVLETSLELVGGRERLAKVAGMLAPFFEVRYKGINAQIPRAGNNSVLEIAVGISPRGMELTVDPRIRFVGTDLKGMVGEQIRLTSRILRGEKRRNLHIMEADAMDSEGIRAAAAALGRQSAPITVVNEGLLVYLTMPEKRRVAENIRGILAPGGAWITPDIYTRQEMDAIIDRDPELMEVMSIVSGATQRDMRQNTFETKEDAVRFFEGIGLSVDRQKSVDGSYNVSSLLRLDVAKDRREALGRMETWVMRPRS